MKSIETWKMNNPYTSIWEKLDILNWRTSLNNLYPNTFHAQHIQIHNSLVWIDRKCQSLSISLTISHSFRTQLFHHSRGAVVKFHKKFQAWLISLIFISLLFSCFYTISSLSPFLCTLSFHTSFPLIISRDLFCICSFSRFIWNLPNFSGCEGKIELECVATTKFSKCKEMQTTRRSRKPTGGMNYLFWNKDKRKNRILAKLLTSKPYIVGVRVLDEATAILQDDKAYISH